MKLRLLVEVLIVGGCLALLAILAAFHSEISRSWQIGSIVGATAIYLVLMWARDRFLPPKTSHLEVKPSASSHIHDDTPRTIREYFNPWFTVVASFALICFSLMIVMRMDTAEAEVTRLMFRVSSWGILVVTAAIFLIRPPSTRANQFIHWWLPGVSLLVLAYLATSRVPDLVRIIAAAPDADHPSVATLSFLPLAVFIWRSIQLVSSLKK